MISRFTFGVLLWVGTACGEVKTKQYTDSEGCIGTYRLATGRVLTSRGLVEDPTVNAIMNEAVSAQMNPLKISEAANGADLEIRFMGGNSAGLQVHDLAIGDVAMWDVGSSQPISDGPTKRAIW
jgi:hypothetical protein